MKTVSWYLHSFQMIIDHLVIITPDRTFLHMSFGKVLNEYGHLRVVTAVVSSEEMVLILDPMQEIK